MSEYYLADRKADEREKTRQRAQEAAHEPKQSQDMKITLLGDFFLPSDEPRGCDPYNSVQGKSARGS
jgi:hypothetical protein